MTIRKTIKQMRRDQRITKKILRSSSLQFYESRSDRAQYVNRSMVYVNFNIARARRSLRYKAQFNRKNKHRIIFVEETAELVGTFHIRSGEEGFATMEYLEEMGKKEVCMARRLSKDYLDKMAEQKAQISTAPSPYSCTLDNPPAPITLKSEEVEVNIGPMKLIENFSGPTKKPELTEKDIQNWLSAGGIY